MGDSELVEEEGVPMSAGQRLRQAREASGLTLEEIATSTRIPTRHLESLEAGDFSRLPAPTYTIGFAKNFAAAVGLDRAEIGDQLRTEMGGSRPVMTTPEVFEPADPARAMPIWLIGAAIAALLLFALLYNWWSNRELQPADEEVAAENVASTAPPPAAVAPQGQGPVVITATEAAWVEIKDGGVLLKQGELAPGETFQVPASALAPTLTTAKPESLRIAVGTTVAPTIGEPAKKVTASLKAEDLLRQRPAVPAAEQPRAEPLVPPRRPAASAPAPATTEPAADAAEPATQNQQ
jgi:cytoskeleton protein RodZ